MKHVRGLDIPQTLADVCDPQRLTLVVYDMQVGILRQIKDLNQVVGKVSPHVAAEGLMGTFAYRMAMAWQRVDDPEAVTPWFLRIRRASPSRRS